jgi:hypothetical protein
MISLALAVNAVVAGLLLGGFYAAATVGVEGAAKPCVAAI